MSSFCADSNPWRNDASFDLSFGGLSRYIEEVSDVPLLSPARSGKLSGEAFTDPFILQLQLADQVIERKRAERSEERLRRLRSETASVFDERSTALLDICASLQKILLDFEAFDQSCDLQPLPTDTEQVLSVRPENQRKVVELLEFSMLLARSNGRLEELQDNAVNMASNLIKNINGRMTRIAHLVEELESIEGVHEAFDAHVKNSR